MLTQCRTVRVRRAAETVRERRGGNNHSVRLSGPVHWSEKTLPLNPYTFGVWLGDGTVAVSGLGCVMRIDADGVLRALAGGCRPGGASATPR